jgi:hypothetical protein
MLKIGALSLSSKEIGVLVLTFLVLVAIFFFSPIPLGGDWEHIDAGLRRFVQGEAIYQVVNFNGLDYGFYQVPWIVVLLSPLAFLPVRLGWAIINAASIFGVLALSQRYQLGLARTILLFASPPILYNIWQGHIDILLLLFLFAPREIWPLASIAKPHVTGGLIFALLRHTKLWLRTAIICAAVILLSFVFFGPWLRELLIMSGQEFSGIVLHSVFKGIWPVQLIVAVGLICFGIERDEERFFVAASPFLSRYATIGNFAGVILVVISVMKSWQAFILVLTWWAVLIAS